MGDIARFTMPPLDYGRAPFLIVWETTRACDLVCRHCRAAARTASDPAELATWEAEDLLDQASRMGTPVVVLSGGDPLMREDLIHLVRRGTELGLQMATTPAASSSLTEDVVARLKEAGLAQMALALDFPRAVRHDGFRGTPGAFAKTMEAVAWARRHRLALQINTLLCSQTAPYLEPMVPLVGRLGAVFWQLYFLVPVGWARTLGGLTAWQCEEIFRILHRVQRDSSFRVMVAEAPHFRRYVVQHECWAAGDEGEAEPSDRRDRTGPLDPSVGPGRTIDDLARRGVSAGNGYLFVSHRGDVFPSSFLPVAAGNVRERSLSSLYRETELFRMLRDPDRLHGPCGRCDFRWVCGGSRARAYALTGDYLASDPWCAYDPPLSAPPPRPDRG